MILYFIVGVSSLSMIGLYSYYKARNALVMRATEQLHSVRAFKKAQLEFFLNQLQACNNPQNSILTESAIDSLSEEICKIMLDTLHTNGLGKSGEVYLIDSQFRMRSPSRFEGYAFEFVKVNTPAAKAAFASSPGYLAGEDYRGRKCLSSYDLLKTGGLNWAIIAEIDYDEALIPIRILRNDLLFLSLIILVLIFSIAQVIHSDIVAPILKLKASAMEVGNGHTDTRVDIDNENELGLLARTFNQMLDRMKANTLELIEEKTQRVSALYDGQEYERHRISRELHDGLAQELIAMKLSLENSLSRKEAVSESQVRKLKDQLGHAIEELRKISLDLAPSGILEFSFESAVKNLCSHTSQATGLNIEFSWHGDFSKTSRRTKIYLYRIIQEALNNTLKHSGADQVHIQMTETPENIVLIIEDNGQGFNFEPCCLGHGKGLFNMRERCSLLGGHLDIETAPGRGATIRIKVKKNHNDE